MKYASLFFSADYGVKRGGRQPGRLLKLAAISSKRIPALI